MLVHCERSGNCIPCQGVASSVDCESGPLSWGGASGTPIGGEGGAVKVAPGGGSVGGERGGRWWHCKGADRGFLPATPRCAGAGARECRGSGQARGRRAAVRKASHSAAGKGRWPRSGCLESRTAAPQGRSATSTQLLFTPV